MGKFSLMFPDDKKYNIKTLDEAACNDLSIEFLCEALSTEQLERNIIKKMMCNIVCDERVIQYRIDVFDDLLHYPDLCDKLENLLVRLNDLWELKRMQKDTEVSAMWGLVNRLREVDDYIQCISQMKEAMDATKLKSEGLQKLYQMVCEIYNGSGFPQLKQDIDETLKKAQSLKSATIGVNFDNLLRPKQAGVVSLNDTEFTHSGLLKNFMYFASNKRELHKGVDDVTALRSFHPETRRNKKENTGLMPTAVTELSAMHIESAVTGADPLSGAMEKAVTGILKRIVRDIQDVLKKYVDISGYSLSSLSPELTFYIRWAALIRKIQKCNLPICKPKVLPYTERRLHTKGMYNMKLAIKTVKGDDLEIITNAVDFDDTHRIYIMTGPNRGGKTTFTQAVGLLLLLAQNGIAVPAESFEFSPCDTIFTHFPADENKTVDLGRLGEESVRLSEIMQRATSNSLVLLNETLATTNVEEGVYLARDIVRFLSFIGVRSVYNTHMHDLARHLEEFNDMEGNQSRVDSLVTGIENGKRSFHVSIAPPQNVSYAHDIAVKYGITFEQLRESRK